MIAGASEDMVRLAFQYYLLSVKYSLSGKQLAIYCVSSFQKMYFDLVVP